MKQRFAAISLLLAAAALSSCSRDMRSDVYTDDATAGKVLEGKIVNVRPVTIKAHDKLEQNELGILGGGATGAAAGSAAGHSSGNIGATIGGAVVGAVAGAYLQEAMSESDGMEYLVRIDKKYLHDNIKTYKRIQIADEHTVERDMTSTSVDTKSDLIAVVQAADEGVMKVGQHVYIVYNNDRPRLVAQ